MFPQLSVHNHQTVMGNGRVPRSVVRRWRRSSVGRETIPLRNADGDAGFVLRWWRSLSLSFSHDRRSWTIRREIRSTNVNVGRSMSITFVLVIRRSEYRSTTIRRESYFGRGTDRAVSNQEV